VFLQKLESLDSTVPLEEIRQYLMAKYDARFDVHPRRFEEVVGSVFKDHGFSVTVTAYSGDNGIDAFLERDGLRTGVQVKRYKGSISVDQIRELTGALVLAGVTKGIFVTTSEFQSGAESVATLSGIRGYPIELMDADKFYDALRIAQIESAEVTVERRPWVDIPEWNF
jgi:restriction system protein